MVVVDYLFAADIACGWSIWSLQFLLEESLQRGLGGWMLAIGQVHFSVWTFLRCVDTLCVCELNRLIHGEWGTCYSFTRVQPSNRVCSWERSKVRECTHKLSSLNWSDRPQNLCKSPSHRQLRTHGTHGRRIAFPCFVSDFYWKELHCESSLTMIGNDFFSTKD